MKSFSLPLSKIIPFFFEHSCYPLHLEEKMALEKVHFLVYDKVTYL